MPSAKSASDLGRSMRKTSGRLRSMCMSVARGIGGLVLTATVACLSSAQGEQTSRSPEAAEVPAIGAVHAHLFQNKTAAWSADVLAPGYAGSWNSIAGPTSANATLVVVEVTGPPGGTFTGHFGPDTRYGVRVVAREGTKKTVLDRTQTVPILNERGKVSVAFLFYQSGCTPVRLTVSIVGAHAPKPVQKSLSFACGE